jgi:phosphoglycolate phosphatase
MAHDLRIFLLDRGVELPSRETRWSAPELARLVIETAPSLEAGFWEIALDHERRALLQATLEPGALDTLRAAHGLGFRTAVWTNNGGVVTRQVLEQLALAPHVDLVVSRDEVRHLKPDPDGLRVIAAHWPDMGEVYVIGDSWVDGLAAKAGGVPFITYRADLEDLERRRIPVWAKISQLREILSLFV